MAYSCLTVEMVISFYVLLIKFGKKKYIINESGMHSLARTYTALRERERERYGAIFLTKPLALHQILQFAEKI